MLDRCPLCQSGDLSLYLNKDGFNVMRCSNCGHLFVANIPQDLSPFYSSGYFNGDLELDGYMDYEADKKACLHTFEEYLNLLNLHSKSEQKKMFEIGCATGVFLDMARTAGWEVSGVDISDYAVSKAKEKGLSVYSGVVSDLPLESLSDIYDAVAMFDVIEHLPDPKIELDFANKILKSGGVLVFASPNSSSLWAKVMGKKWHAFVPPQHLHFFSKDNVMKVADQTGFEVVSIVNLGKKFTIPYIFRMLHTWQGLNLWSRLADYSAKKKIFNQIKIPINLHDTMVVVARKK